MDTVVFIVVGACLVQLKQPVWQLEVNTSLSDEETCRFHVRR